MRPQLLLMPQDAGVADHCRQQALRGAGTRLARSNAEKRRFSEKNMLNRDEGMVVYDGVSKFFPVRERKSRKDRAQLMVALDRISASVGAGELITLLGPSGCGKTTLLRLTA